MMGGSSGRYPFTASQWQELEHQTLIFKYMISGTPVPHDLIIPIRRSLSFYSDPMLLFHHQPNLGWGNFQVGFGKKADDPEPWRCRRTDGKKWRCSKEAFPESKYCERHMHRGKNRSRKPVETLNPSILVAKPMTDGHLREMRDSSWRCTQLGLSFNGGSSFMQQDSGERDKRGECFLMGKDMKAEKVKSGIFPMTQLSISMGTYDKGSWVDGSRSSIGN